MARMFNRREFMLRSAGAGVGAAALPGLSYAEAAVPPAALAPVTGPMPWKIDIYSKHLQFLRDPHEVALAAKAMGYDGLDVTVRPYPGHIDPAKVRQDLPPFVKAVRSHGVEVHLVTAPIADADSPHAEEILETAASLGIHSYWWGSFQYVKGQPILPQLEAMRPRVAKLARLNEKYGMTAMYHCYGGEHTVNDKVYVSGPMWDLLHVLKDQDPRFVGIQWDSCHMTNAGGMRTWELNLRAAGPYIRGVTWKDSLPEKAADGRWLPRYLPLGHGNVELTRANAVLREIGFNGPMEIQPEHMKGAAGDGKDKLAEPKDWVFATMTEDLRMLRAAIAESETYKL